MVVWKPTSDVWGWESQELPWCWLQLSHLLSPQAGCAKQREVSSGMSRDSGLSVGPFRFFLCNIDVDMYSS